MYLPHGKQEYEDIHLLSFPGKRGIDYSREDVEKIFTYLRGEIDKCESEFIKKFDEKKADKFKVTKNPRTPAQPESLYLGYPRI